MTRSQLTAEEWLAHHGVKGMKWGVRKEDQRSGIAEKGDGWVVRKDGSIEIDKTATISRVVRGTSGLFGGAGVAYDSGAPVYAAFKPSDIAQYEHFFGRRETFLTKQASTVQKFHPANTLRAPGPKEAAAVYYDMLSKNPKFRDQVAGQMIGGYAKRKLERAFKDPTTQEAYDIYSLVLDSSNYNSARNVNQQYFAELKKRGYNMLVDPSDAAGGFDTPVMIFDGKTNLSLKTQYLVDKHSQEKARLLYKQEMSQLGKTYLEQQGYL